jgi:hypothetical protein
VKPSSGSRLWPQRYGFPDPPSHSATQLPTTPWGLGGASRQTYLPHGGLRVQAGEVYVPTDGMHGPAGAIHGAMYGPTSDWMHDQNTTIQPRQAWFPYPQALPHTPSTYPTPSSPFGPPDHHVSAGGVYGGYGLAAQETDSSAAAAAEEDATLEESSVRGSHDLSPAPLGTDTNYQLSAAPPYSDCLNSFKRQEVIALPHLRHYSSEACLVFDPRTSAPVVPESTRTRRSRSDSNPPLPVPRSPPHTVCKPLSWSAMGPPAPFQGVTRFSPTTLYEADHPVLPIQSILADSRDVLNTCTTLSRNL